MMWIALVPAVWTGVAVLLGLLVGGCIRAGGSSYVAVPTAGTPAATPTEAAPGEDDDSSAERRSEVVTGAV